MVEKVIRIILVNLVRTKPVIPVTGSHTPTQAKQIILKACTYDRWVFQDIAGNPVCVCVCKCACVLVLTAMVAVTCLGRHACVHCTQLSLSMVDTGGFCT